MKIGKLIAALMLSFVLMILPFSVFGRDVGNQTKANDTAQTIILPMTATQVFQVLMGNKFVKPKAAYRYGLRNRKNIIKLNKVFENKLAYSSIKQPPKPNLSKD